MTPQERGLFVIAGAGALVVWLISPFTPLGLGKGAAGAAGNVEWNPRRPRGHEGPCPSETIAGALERHPLYRRPPRCGHNRQIAIDRGWDWISSPPSDQDF